MYIKLFTCMLMTVAWVVSASADDPPYGQECLEQWLCHIEPDDNPGDNEPPYVPHRFRDSLPEFEVFFERSGWTTNQFVDGLIFAVTNNLAAISCGDKEKRRIAGRAVWKLSEINRPAVTNFFRHFNDTDDTPLFKSSTIPAMVYYTNLEPDVMTYMRTLCIRTNIYDNVAFGVVHNLYETLDTMPSELKLATTNRVAKFIYFSLFHRTRQMLWDDRKLAQFIPAYSNSVQRLELMRHISVTATNVWQRAHAQIEFDRLSAIPTNQLNDISWIAEE